MLVNIEGVAQPSKNGVREIVPYVYTSEDNRKTPSEVRDANHAREIVRRLCIPESVFVDSEPPRGEDYDPMWIIQISVLGTRQKITRYRTGYHKYDGCPLAAIGYMMDIHAAIRKILKNSRKELERERKEQKEKKEKRNDGRTKKENYHQMQGGTEKESELPLGQKRTEVPRCKKSATPHMRGRNGIQGR